ncbi:hypothetical protein HYX00_02500 [Candidatus Woesearchaeota archaeon]|nr:hypothetical protein [Candidatus Woesearchaeota archaeon]
MKKSKWKIDEITLVLIVAVIAMVVSVYDKANEPKITEAEKIIGLVTDEHSISFANNGIIDENKLREIKDMSYNDFKKSLNVKNDFCIYIEDGDGNVIFAKGSLRLDRGGVCV